MVRPQTLPIRLDPELTISGEQLVNLIERLDDPNPGPRHTVGVDVKRHYLGDTPMSPPYLDVWCSCGWKGPQLSVDPDVALDDLPAEILEEAARAWRFHVRLSNRVSRIDRRLRRRSEPIDLSRTPEFAIEEARRAAQTKEEEE